MVVVETEVFMVKMMVVVVKWWYGRRSKPE